jgi:phosphomannomutase
MEERDYRFDQQKKDEIYQQLLVDKLLPELPMELEKVSYLDGCKLYFKNGGWIGIRFSGTEPLLRIFCEMPVEGQEKHICRVFETFLGLEE